MKSEIETLQYEIKERQQNIDGHVKAIDECEKQIVELQAKPESEKRVERIEPLGRLGILVGVDTHETLTLRLYDNDALEIIRPVGGVLRIRNAQRFICKLCVLALDAMAKDD